MIGVTLTLVMVVGIVNIVPLDEVGAALQQTNILMLLLALAPALVNIYVRGTRWAVLFRPCYAVRGRDALGPALIGLGLNAVLPGRIGDLARVSIGARKFGVSPSFVGSTVVVERLLDMGILLGLVAGATAYLPDLAQNTSVAVLDYDLSSAAITRVMERVRLISGALMALLVLALAPRFQQLSLGFIRRVPGIGHHLNAWMAPKLADVRDGLQVLKQPGALAVAIGMSALIWGSLAVGNVLVAGAIDGVELNLAQALVVTAIAIAASFLPSVPGAWGIYEAGTLLGLAMVRASPADSGVAVAFALVSHLLTYLPVVVLAGIAGFRSSTDLPIVQLRRATRTRDG